jgi:hypothetical protein
MIELPEGVLEEAVGITPVPEAGDGVPVLERGAIAVPCDADSVGEDILATTAQFILWTGGDGRADLDNFSRAGHPLRDGFFMLACFLRITAMTDQKDPPQQEAWAPPGRRGDESKKEAHVDINLRTWWVRA